MPDSICRNRYGTETQFLEKTGFLKHQVVAILQARMGSTRFPGKVLTDLCGRPMLEVLLRRLRSTRSVTELVVATTLRPEDEAICSVARKMGVSCFRGSEEDCLDRYYQAAKAFKGDMVVRLTGDNPLVDAGFVDWVVESLFEAGEGYAYVRSSSDQGFPLGLSVEAFRIAALEMAWREDHDSRSREHVTTFMVSQPQRFRRLDLACSGDYSDMRWTVDTPEDLDFARRVVAYFGHTRFRWQEAADAVRRHPEWL